MTFRSGFKLTAVVICLAGILHEPPPGNPRSTVQACEIHFEKIVELKGDEVGSAPVALLTSDRVFLHRSFAPGEIAVFDRRGEFLRTLGRLGEGPGEFRSISGLVALPDGGLAAFDSRLSRLTYFTSDLEVGSVHQLPVRVWRDGAVRLQDGGWVLAGQMAEWGAFGSPLARVDSVGQVPVFYGRNETEKEGNLKGMMAERRVAYHPLFGAVSMKMIDYFLELWEHDGTLAEVFAPEVDWFHWPPPLEPGTDPHVSIGKPEDLFFGIQFDEAGRLWILAQVEGEDWESGVEEGKVVDREKWADFFIEVLDLGARQTLCTARITDKSFIGGFPAPAVLHSYSEDWLGRPTVTFWRLSLSATR